ncbi:6-hydroxymethylpterin diphosphokinase MptE-like protein [Arsukibacterium sp.]|uniref:6-hydroxymethylpterin diphosphokinase MptE-like protein n=1 Tax=Arsukibacterium sp. TaxID=1977258 RepID=UPI002FD9EA42
MHYSLYNQIQLHSKLQSINEQQLAESITYHKKINHIAFEHYCPSLLPLIHQVEQESVRFSLFCNNKGKANVIDRQNSTAVYEEDPDKDAEREVKDFISKAPFISLTPIQQTDHWSVEALPEQVDVVCMMGMGLGHQILPLISERKISCLIIYEPDLTMLQCSVKSVDWQSIFITSAKQGTLISLQMGKDGSDIASDLNELCMHIPKLQKFYVYRHLSNPVTDEVLATLFQLNGNKAELLKKNRQYLGYTHPADYLPVRFKGILGNKQYQHIDSSLHDRFEQNITAFEQFYPEIAQLIRGFEAKRWLLVEDECGKVNLWHSARNALLHKDKDIDAELTINYSLNQPSKDDVILGQKVAWKFRHYVHYQAIAKLQPLFSEMAQQKSIVPEQINSLIIFGLGVGAFLPSLLARREISNLYLCEPNIEHFYASLFVTDWAGLFNEAALTEKRVYLNIGGDGSDYFNDLMQQFYSVGAFSIASTYILQTTANAFLNENVNRLREQLKVVLTIGDYYDHARFGISHTYKSFQLGHNWLKADRSSYIHHKATQLPVFIVGNGPSLDQCADYIKEHRHNVILVSCGTALKPLYHLGLTPDFHAEVEQNRSTHLWITQVKDVDYLKRIRLISVNGIHPDTAALFADTYLAFKEGEASTTLFNKALRNAESIAQLRYAYPTVSNLAVNWLLQAGFKQLYLLGVDLGYVDINNHHSIHSIYYKNGQSTYDYSKKHGQAIPVAGNFRPSVKTKIEFDISRRILEQNIKFHPDSVEIYNCSDGAFITGASSLQPGQILTFKPETNVSVILSDFLQLSSSENDFSNDLNYFDRHYSVDSIVECVKLWRELLIQPVTDYMSARSVIEQQWILFKQQAALYEGVVFYLLYRSSCYFLSLMTKLLPMMQQNNNRLEEKALSQFKEITSVWSEYLAQLAEDFAAEKFKLDTTTW